MSSSLKTDSFACVLGSARGSQRCSLEEKPLYCSRDGEGTLRFRLYRGGPLHRQDDPAVIGNDYVEWWYDGKLHRSCGPAVIRKDSYEWWLNGVLHRDDGPAVVTPDKEEWYAHGLLHRGDGPAVKRQDGYPEWRQNGVLHCYNGPAIVYPQGIVQYYIDGVERYGISG